MEEMISVNKNHYENLLRYIKVIEESIGEVEGPYEALLNDLVRFLIRNKNLFLNDKWWEMERIFVSHGYAAIQDGRDGPITIKKLQDVRDDDY